LYKRLERGQFQIPVPTSDQKEIQLSYEKVVMLLEGIDLASIPQDAAQKRRKRYREFQNQFA